MDSIVSAEIEPQHSAKSDRRLARSSYFSWQQEPEDDSGCAAAARVLGGW